MKKKLNNNLYEHCFIEFEEYTFKTYEDIIPNELFIRGICVKENQKLIFKCTGFIISNNQLFVIFPKGYNIPKSHTDLKWHIRILINTLFKYSEDSTLEPSEESLLGGLGKKREFISAAFWLIQNYFTYGLINFSHQSYEINQSLNINWGRTIKTKNPVISNKRPVYLDLVTKKNMMHDNLITQIHKYAIDYCLDFFGWFFDFDIDESIEYNLPCDRELAIYLLENEIQNTFDERKSNILLKLKEFIIGSNDDIKDDITIFVTPFFHVVWEKICYSLFNDYMKKPPKPYWNVNNILAKTEQIPDVLFIKNNKLFVLDAKYFQIKYAPKKLPGWGDLVKQFYYRLTLKYNIDDEIEEIENVFIFPGHTTKKIDYLGFAAVEGMKDLGKINGFIMDPHEAMNSYVNNNTGEFKNLLIQFINKHD